MTPSFFGPEGEQLLGIHHPARGASKSHGVVLCPPAPQERARSHWAFRKLAEQLAKAGFDVLRFDLRGTGDSNGELEDTTPQQWVEDVKRAVKELKDITGHRKLSVVGFRLGALLSAQAASDGLALDTLVLWEPVVSVANWIARVQQLEEEVHRRELHFPPPFDPSDVYGFRLPPALLEAWRALDFAWISPWKARTEIVVAEDNAHFARLHRTWEKSGQSATWHHVGGPASGATGALLGNEALDRIVALLGERR